MKKRNNIGVILTQGLGNQMFHYAQCVKMAKDITLNLSQCAEIVYYQEFFPLGEFNLPKDVRVEKKSIPDTAVVWDDWTLGRKIPANKKIDYISGGWIEAKGLDKIRPRLLRDLTLKKPTPAVKKYAQKIKSEKNSISIHVRRGDYIIPSMKFEHFQCGLDYYKKAIEILNQKGINGKFFIFSDDPKWCAENFDFLDNFEIVSGAGFSASGDLYLMSLCKHNIIANSTFAWWSGWLNKNPNKVVIMPDLWFLRGDYIQYRKNMEYKNTVLIKTRNVYAYVCMVREFILNIFR